MKIWYNKFIFSTTTKINTCAHEKIYVQNIYKMMVEIFDMMDISISHPHFSNLPDRVTYLTSSLAPLW